MIMTLHIKNIGIIDDLEIDFTNGFNVLTGETGAGKTLIIDSLGIIAGGRFSKEMIRKGQTQSFVEMCIYLPDNSKAIDGNIIVSREIYSNGRNLCKINGRLVTVSELKEFMSNVIDIHAQNDNQNLLDANSHIKYLDSFSGENLLKYKVEYQKLYEEYNNIKFELKRNYGDDKEKQRKLDLLKYQLNEIEEAKLKTNEDEKLEEQRKMILNSEKISDNLNEADSQLGTNAIDSIDIAIRNLEKIEDLNIHYKNSLNSLKSIYYDLQEIARDISEYKYDTFFDEGQKEEIENRLDLIYSLKRKYGNNIEEILTYKDNIEKEIETIENLEEYIKKLKKELAEIENKMYEIAKKMNEIRSKSAIELQNSINKELTDLEMKNAKFKVDINFNTKKDFNKNGLDNVEFLIATNIGEDQKPLIKIASGGEMSRIMLAIKTVLANVDEVPVLVFDEIDTGISGIAAKSVAEKLKTISKTHQVLTVTHLGAIAAKADSNYKIFKNVEKELTKTNVVKLKEKEILEEIARITSGSITELSLKHAQELRMAV